MENFPFQFLIAQAISTDFSFYIQGKFPEHFQPFFLLQKENFPNIFTIHFDIPLFTLPSPPPGLELAQHRSPQWGNLHSNVRQYRILYSDDRLHFPMPIRHNSHIYAVVSIFI